jgi:hypothetical protein
MSGTDLGTPPMPIGLGREPRLQVAAITESPGSNPDYWKLISEYLQLRTIPDDELYHHGASGILQRCIPIEEGKVLLLDIHEGICEHLASSRSMVGKAFQQGFY